MGFYNQDEEESDLESEYKGLTDEELQERYEFACEHDWSSHQEAAKAVMEDRGIAPENLEYEELDRGEVVYKRKMNERFQ